MTRVVKKSLAGEEDLLLGVGTQVQTRGGADYTINKLRFLKPATDIVDLIAVSTLNYVDVLLREIVPGSGTDGGFFYWDSTRAKTDHDGVTVISPTVPWENDYTSYKAGTFETNPSDDGVWVRYDSFGDNVLTSIDTTDGRQWINSGTEGMFGLGASTLTLSTADVDTYVVSGTYAIDSTATNNEFAADSLLVVHTLDANNLVQTLINLATGERKQRLNVSGTFQTWDTIAIVTNDSWSPEFRNYPAGLQATTVSVVDAHYLKVGNMVTVSCVIDVTDSSNLAGADLLAIGNLPFAANASAQGVWRGVASASNTTSAENVTHCRLTSTDDILLVSSDTNDLTQQYITDGSTQIAISLTYLEA